MPGLIRITLPAGVASVTMEFGKDAGAGTGTTVTTYSFKLALWRVN